MEEEKTLLQQIREKELEFARKIDEVKGETDRAVEAARNEAEDLLCTADSTAKTDAERLYWEKKGEIETDIEEMRHRAGAELAAAVKTAEENLPRAVDAITRAVTME
jgi:vacuolar-type H+-ATPase subunit H